MSVDMRERPVVKGEDAERFVKRHGLPTPIELHPSNFDVDWCKGNIDIAKRSLAEGAPKYAIGKLQGVIEHLQRTVRYIEQEARKE
jgi:hypothetical protein